MEAAAEGGVSAGTAMRIEQIYVLVVATVELAAATAGGVAVSHARVPMCGTGRTGCSDASGSCPGNSWVTCE